MASLLASARSGLRGVLNAFVSLLPTPPSDDAPPPDIDGRRPSTIDPETLRHIDRLRKAGKGGNR